MPTTSENCQRWEMTIFVLSVSARLLTLPTCIHNLGSCRKGWKPIACRRANFLGEQSSLEWCFVSLTALCYMFSTCNSTSKLLPSTFSWHKWIWSHMTMWSKAVPHLLNINSLDWWFLTYLVNNKCFVHKKNSENKDRFTGKSYYFLVKFIS